MKPTLFDRYASISESRKKSVFHGIRATALDAFAGIFVGTTLFLLFKPSQIGEYFLSFLVIEILIAITFFLSNLYIKKVSKENK